MPDIFAERDADSWTLGLALEARTDLTPDAPFVSFRGEEPASFGAFRRKVVAAARWLAGQGVKRGEIVALAMPNSTETLVWWFALNALGAVDAAINPALVGEPLAHVLRLVRARRLLASPSMLAPVLALEDTVPDLETIWIVPDEGEGPLPAAAGRIRTEPAMPLSSDGDAALPRTGSGLQPPDVATIIYTSGTTGPAKAVQMTHAQVFVVAELTRQGLWLSGSDTTFCAHPLFHMAARDCGVLPCLLTGGRLALDARFEPSAWVDRIIATGATATLMHGPLIEMVHAQPPRPEDGLMPLTRLGSSPFPRHIARAFEARFGVKGIETWGMTEIGIPAWHPADEPLRPGSCGRIRDEWFEFRVADPQTDRELPDGAVGEFQVRPRRPGVIMAGYYGAPEETLKAQRNLWFHTGDFGHRDAEGWLWFSGRAADRIRRRAENISAHDIEHAASGAPGIQESAAIGVPSGFDSDDDILLCVLVAPGAAAPAPLAVLERLAGKLPHHMLPRYIRVMDEFPRSATGKIRKDLLKRSFVPAATWDRQAEGISVRGLYGAEAGEEARASPE